MVRPRVGKYTWPLEISANLKTTEESSQPLSASAKRMDKASL